MKDIELEIGALYKANDTIYREMIIKLMHFKLNSLLNSYQATGKIILIKEDNIRITRGCQRSFIDFKFIERL